MNDPLYPPRGQRSEPVTSDDLPRRGHPVREPGDPRGTDLPRRGGQRISGSSLPPNVVDDFAKRGKPVAEPIVPSRPLAPDADDLPPRRSSSAAVRSPAGADDYVPPRRGQSVRTIDEDYSTMLPPRGKPATEPSAPPRRPAPETDYFPPRRPGGGSVRPTTDAEDAPPRRTRPAQQGGEAEAVNDSLIPQRTNTSEPAPASPPPQTASPAAPVSVAATAESASTTVTFTTGNVAAEIEDILTMLENHITSAMSARDLHTLASLIFILGKHVSRLAKEKDETAKVPSVHEHADAPPEPED